MSHKLHLVGIDWQNSFCAANGELSVPGAWEAGERVAAMIGRLQGKWDDIHLTMDSHHLIHVGHPIYWKDSSGKHPAPFTIISLADVKSGRWSATHVGWQRRAEDYVEQLEKNGRYPLCIWPPHCLIGSEGHNIIKPIWDAITKWELEEFAMVDFVTKGSNLHTENYSAIMADVPDPSDITTQINTGFLDILNEADIIALTGIAGSHCLANTVRDIVKYFNNPDFTKKLVLLEDATAPVPGFESLQDQFIKDMVAEGMGISNTVDFLK